MKSCSTISSKGQVTVPQKIRARLGLSAGDQVEFVIEGELTVIRPARTASNPFDKYKGVLPAFSSEKEIHSWVDDLRSADPPAKKRGSK